jgi:uncharacterized protein YprB with RNaseH-like and TPR domain
MEETLRQRLESLNRAPLPNTTQPANGEAAVPGLRSSKAATTAQTQQQPPRHPPQALSPPSSPAHPQFSPGLLRSGEPVETAHGQHLRIRLPVERLWHNGSQLIAARQEFLQLQLAAAQQAIEPTVAMNSEFASLVAALPDRTVALDLETCGLAGSALFLIGLCRHVDGQPTVEMLFARNYAEEAAVLDTLWQTIAGQAVLLTFNGKTFDWPMVMERSIRHRLQFHAPHDPFLHIDILHHARRRWKKSLPNCRLQTLETHVCRRHRTDDIPGHRIPAVYADFVRTGFERDIDSVLHHNALDVVTLFDLALRLAA